MHILFMWRIQGQKIDKIVTMWSRNRHIQTSVFEAYIEKVTVI